jgi:glucokinase
VVLGAGTGFGVSGIARSERGDVPISTEGGHACFAPSDEVEDRLLARLRGKFGRVSIERVLSGPGIHDIYLTLAELAGAAPTHADERAVLAAGQAGGDAVASATLDRFCTILGCVAGDLALTFGARGGVYVSGGLAPRMGERLFAGGFRSRFEDKGRLSTYTRDIPTYLMLHPYAALVGAARALEQLEGAVL